MRLISFLTLLACVPAAAAAQAAKDHPALPAKQVEVLLPAKPAEPAPKPPQQAAAAAKSEQAETKTSSETAPSEEEGRVLVDSLDGKTEKWTENAETGREAETAQSGIPSSYGQLKGTLTEGGRSYLVFENEEGTISLVQLVTGKDSVSWKLASQITRSAD